MSTRGSISYRQIGPNAFNIFRHKYYECHDGKKYVEYGLSIAYPIVKQAKDYIFLKGFLCESANSI